MADIVHWQLLEEMEWTIGDAVKWQGDSIQGSGEFISLDASLYGFTTIPVFVRTQFKSNFVSILIAADPQPRDPLTFYGSGVFTSTPASMTGIGSVINNATLVNGSGSFVSEDCTLYGFGIASIRTINGSGTFVSEDSLMEGFGGIGLIPPTLFNPKAYYKSDISLWGTVDTNFTDYGTIYWYVSLNDTEPSINELKSGSGSVAHGSQQVQPGATQTIATMGGLTVDTGYYVHYLHAHQLRGDSNWVVTPIVYTTYFENTIHWAGIDELYWTENDLGEWL